MSIDRHAGNPAEPRVTGPEAMLDAIRAYGIIPFFENIVPGYSIEEMTPPGNWFDTQEDLTHTPWDWKIHCVQSGEIVYGKFLLGGKAAFATIGLYKELMNWRRSLPANKPTADQQKILDYVAENGSISIKEVRHLLGIKKGQADALMTRLQMQCRIATGDIIRVYRGADLHYNGWQTSSFCAPESLWEIDNPWAARFGDVGPMVPVHSPMESFLIVKETIGKNVPGISDKLIDKLLQL